MPPEPLFPAEPPPKPATAEMGTQTDPQDMGLIYDPETDQYLTPEQLRGREEALHMQGEAAMTPALANFNFTAGR